MAEEYVEQPEPRKEGEKPKDLIVENMEEKQPEPEMMQEYKEPTARDRIIGGIQKSTNEVLTGIKNYREKKKGEQQAQEQPQPQQRQRVVIPAQQPQRQNLFGGGGSGFGMQSQMASPMFNSPISGQTMLARMNAGGMSPLAQMSFNMKNSRPQAPARPKRQSKARRPKKVKQQLTPMQKMSMASFGKFGMFNKKGKRWF